MARNLKRGNLILWLHASASAALLAAESKAVTRKHSLFFLAFLKEKQTSKSLTEIGVILVGQLIIISIPLDIKVLKMQSSQRS